MDKIAHRIPLIARLKDYPNDHRLFLELTRQEYYATAPVRPKDSVKSPAMDGMPHGTEVSNPTLSIVCQRETIIERVVAQQGKLDAELIKVTDRLMQFWDWWSTLTDVTQAFVNLRYWKRGTYQEVARYFRAEGEHFYGAVPDSEKKVLRFEDDLLADLDHLWYYGGQKGGK